jgi:hypothetical protein
MSKIVIRIGLNNAVFLKVTFNFVTFLIWRWVCRESSTKDMLVQECCMKDDSRPITVAVQAEAVNHLSVLV